jgi:hypothetical protein
LWQLDDGRPDYRRPDYRRFGYRWLGYRGLYLTLTSTQFENGCLAEPVERIANKTGCPNDRDIQQDAAFEHHVRTETT